MAIPIIAGAAAAAKAIGATGFGKAIGSMLPSIIGGGMGMLGGKKARKEQQKQQEALNRQRHEMDLDFFKKTMEMQSPKNQRRMLEEAGLNPGLMYGMSGATGTTGQVGNASGGQAPVIDSVGMGVQGASALNAMRLTGAQVENIEADTNLKNVEANKKAGVDTEEGKSKIELLKQQAKTEAEKTLVTRFEGLIKSLESDLLGQTFWAQKEKIISEHFEQYYNEHLKGSEFYFQQETMDERIKLMEQAVLEKTLEIEAKNLGLQLTKEEITLAQEKILTLKNERDIAKREIIVKELQQQFNTSDAAKIKQWTEVGADVTGMFADVMKKGGVNIKYDNRQGGQVINKR